MSRTTRGEKVWVFSGRSARACFWGSKKERLSSGSVLSIYIALRVPLRDVANQIDPCQNPAHIWLVENFDVDFWRRRFLGPVPNVQPLRFPSGDIKSLLQSFFIVEISKFELPLETVNIHHVPDWQKFSRLTSDGTGRWDRCQKASPRVLYGDTKSLPQSSSIVEISRFKWSNLQKRRQSAWTWLAAVLVVNVWRRREMRPVPKDGPFQMPLEDIKSVLPSLFIVKIPPQVFNTGMWLQFRLKIRYLCFPRCSGAVPIIQGRRLVSRRVQLRPRVAANFWSKLSNYWSQHPGVWARERAWIEHSLTIVRNWRNAITLVSTHFQALIGVFPGISQWNRGGDAAIRPGEEIWFPGHLKAALLKSWPGWGDCTRLFGSQPGKVIFFFILHLPGWIYIGLSYPQLNMPLFPLLGWAREL